VFAVRFAHTTDVYNALLQFLTWKLGFVINDWSSQFCSPNMPLLLMLLLLW